MTMMKIRQLIDMAIGFPEPGHVNFSALHCLLICVAEKLGITDDLVDYQNIETGAACCLSKLSNRGKLVKKSRIAGGFDPEDIGANEAPPEAQEVIVIEESPNADDREENDVIAIDVVQPEPEILVEPTIEAQQQEEDAIDAEQRAIVEIESSSESEASEVTVHKLKERISEIEFIVKNITISDAISSALSVMKDQLDFIMEQILLLTFLTLSKKPDSKQIQQLFSMAQTLIELKEDNIYIKGFKEIKFPQLNWQSSGLQLSEELSENDVLEVKSTDSELAATEAQTTHRDELGGHLCYSPAKLLDQLMELKSEFCRLTNKVNELSARLLHQESQRTLALIQEMQEQVKDIKLTIVNLKENQSRMELRITTNQGAIEIMKKTIEEILEDKVDKTHFEIQLANKVDYNQLQRKVSLDQILELQCRIDKKFCEMLRRINENDKRFSETVENLKNTLGFAAIDEVLRKFKENVSKDIQSLQELLKSYIDATNDDCAAAGSRIKVLHDLACLSCDTSCVTRIMEKSKVAKLPSAHASNIISPLITYELGSIRKSGIMGYYRKDEFPHATNAWLANQSNLKECVQRHAGGQHTTISAKERVQKTMSSRK